MLVNAPECLARELSSDGPEPRDAPRKRSKVSRACDACRRKKVRCNAEFLSSQLKVTKICTNCSKVGDECLFSRVPLKRGPSKGYLKDLSDRVDNSSDTSDFGDSSLPRPRLKLMDVAGYSTYATNGLNGAPLSPMSATNIKPILHRLKFSSTSGIKQPIILPPLLGGLPGVTLNTHVGKPTQQSLPGVTQGLESPDARIVGPLWKVPYEMPTSNGPGLGSSSPGPYNRVEFDSRRSSVDSVSSVLTVGSRSRMTSYHILGPHATDGHTTSPDSEDMGKNTSNSPRNSVSSLSSLNGRMTKTLQLNNELPEDPNLQRYKNPQFPSSQAFTTVKPFGVNGKLNPVADLKQAAISTVCPIPLNSLDRNLSIYYSLFHLSFPILPTNRSIILHAISDLLSSSSLCLEVAQLFNAALNNLINCQFITLEASKHLLLRAISSYPIQTYIPTLKEKVQLIFSASLILINYAILLRGEHYALGISLTLGILNDMDIFKGFLALTRIKLPSIHIDEIQIYLLHLYSCLEIIDSCYSLSFGKQHQSTSFLIRSSATLNDAYTGAYPESHFLKNIPIAKLVRALVEHKDEYDRSTGDLNQSLLLLILSSKSESELNNFSRHFSLLLRETYLVHDFLLEVSDFLHNKKGNSLEEDDECIEHIHDYHLKTSRLVKKLSQSILNYANYVSTLFLQSRSPSGTNVSEFNNPFFNLSYSRALNLIKLSKKLVDLLTTHVNNSELYTRSLKINNNLSIAFNLLMGNLNTNFNIVTNAKAFLSDQSKSNTSLPNHTEVYGLGICCMNTLSKNIFDLSFNEISAPPESEKTSLKSWRDEILAITEKFVGEDLSEGWL